MSRSRLKSVKLRPMLSFCAAAALARPALAADQQAISAPALATSEAALDLCARVDPKSANQYRQQGKLLLQGLER